MIRFSLFFLTLFFLVSPARAAPNILVILMDDVGYSDVGFNGGTQIKTPNIDRLASEGTVFTQAYVASSVCAPSRAGLLTGRYPTRFGFENNQPAGVTAGLPLNQITIANVLRNAGYETGMVGKWHEGGDPVYRPLQRGFNSFYGFLPSASKYLPPIQNIWRNNTKIVEGRYLTTAFGQEASAFIHANKNHPWFLYLATNAAHAPLQATPALLSRYPGISDPKRRTYAAVMSGLDDAVGVVAAQLRNDGVDNNTLIFLLSDNGGPPWMGATNIPLRGGKAGPFEGGVRVPFFMRWPGHINPGKFHGTISSMDILPTSAAVTGAQVPPAVDGVNLMPFLQSGGNPHPFLAWRLATRTSGAQFSALSGEIKLDGVGNNVTIFNLANDIHEDRNIRTPALYNQMIGLYNAWNSKNIRPMW